MKKIMILLLLAALLLTGCAADPHPEWNKLTRADNLLAAETPEGFTLNESKGALSLNGVYYFTWSKGEGTKVTNAQGDEATVYDCQIYLLAAECDSLDAAKKHIAEWSAREETSYDVTPIETVEAGAGYDCMLLSPKKDGSPFATGAAAFAASDTAAISVEIFSANGFQGDLSEILRTFLNGIRMD